MTRAIDEESLENSFIQFLSKGKFRKTPERFEILHKALEMESHFEVDALHAAIEKDGYHVSRATVYNTVELLEKAGILRKNEFGKNSASYEVKRDNHIHLVCKRCGKIREIANAHIASHIMQLNPENFNTDSFAVTLYGVCGDCAKTINKK